MRYYHKVKIELNQLGTENKQNLYKSKFKIVTNLSIVIVVEITIIFTSAVASIRRNSNAIRRS